MRWIFTDVDRLCKDEYQEELLSEETGWWFPNGDILIWTKQPFLMQIGVGIHESIEYILVHKILRRLFFTKVKISDGCPKKYEVFTISEICKSRKWFNFLSDVAHNIANYFEFFLSLGTADQHWGRQDWKLGLNKKDPTYEAWKKRGERI
jgi:hypothetical protein